MVLRLHNPRSNAYSYRRWGNPNLTFGDLAPYVAWKVVYSSRTLCDKTAEDSQTIAEVLLRFYLSILPYQMALSVCKQLFLRFR